MIKDIITTDLADKTKLDTTTSEWKTLVNALQKALINESAVSIPHLTDMTNPNFVEDATFILATLGWIDTTIRNKYASISINIPKLLQFISNSSLEIYRFNAKLDKYMPRYVEDVQPDNLTKSYSGIKDTGLVREGFAKASNKAYKYDTKYLTKYYDAILTNTTKGMAEVVKKYEHIKLDEANFALISKAVLDDILICDAKYNLECNINDSRGRSIYGGLKRVFNPIGYKDARALLIADQATLVTKNSTAKLSDIYLFIAELLGIKRSTNAKREFAARIAYRDRKLHDLDLTTEKGLKDLHENIWLERIYEALDIVYTRGLTLWNIPLEVDATMSLAQIVGTVLGEKRLLDSTNVINPNELKDAWTVEGVARASAKTQVAVFYGSSATTTTLLRQAGIEINKDEVKALNREFSKGAFAVIKALKNLLIHHSNIKSPSYTIQAWNETYTVEVNKYKAVKANLNAYRIWDPNKKVTKQFFMHSPIKVPDYERFKLYMATSFVHNLDSNICNSVTLSAINKGEWVIAIHDAFLVLPGSAVRTYYTRKLDALYLDRKEVLNNFLASIGATTVASKIAHIKLLDLVEPLDTATLNACTSALK